MQALRTAVHSGPAAFLIPPNLGAPRRAACATGTGEAADQLDQVGVGVKAGSSQERTTRRAIGRWFVLVVCEGRDESHGESDDENRSADEP